MGYVKIRIKDIGSSEDLKRWEDHMLEKAKCWNNFCLGICAENEVCAVHVVKQGNADIVYLTTLCNDCIKDTSAKDILVNDKYLMVESHKKHL